MMRIGTTGSAAVVLQNGAGGAANHGWGWADKGWGSPGTNIYFASTGTHTVRVQQREDGALIDQIVLSPDQYFTVPPGGRQDDATILTATRTGCATSFTPSAIHVGAPQATWSITVTSTCTWIARSDFDWLEIKNPATGLFEHGRDLTFTGSTMIRVHALSNTGARRKGYFSIAGQLYCCRFSAPPGITRREPARCCGSSGTCSQGPTRP
jgi:hypothetical protein